VQLAFNVPLLRRREIMIEQDELGFGTSHGSGDFLQLAFSDKRRRIELIAPLQNFSDYFRAGAGGQLSKFGERVFRREC
jgi:hypothetical protein